MLRKKSKLTKMVIAMSVVAFAIFPVASQADDTIISSSPNAYIGTSKEQQLFQKAADLDMQAQVLVQKGDLDKAEKLFLQAFATDPTGGDATPGIKIGCSGLGDLYYRTRNWQKCVQYYTYASDLALSKSGAGGNYYDWFRYSVALLKTGNVTKSRLAYNKGIESLVSQNNRNTVGETIEDTFFDDYVPKRRLEAAARVAVAATEYNSKELVKEECEAALAIMPEYAPAHLKLGRYYFDTGNKGAAKKEWLEAISLSRDGRRTIETAQKWLKEK